MAASPRLAPAVLALLVLWEFVIQPVAASRTLFWYDELFTFHVSQVHPFSALLKALYDGADPMPPAYFAILKLVRLVPFHPLVALRLPSIAGYVLTLVGVYWFVRKRLTASAALVSVLVIVLSPFRGYALEARPYALVVGLLSVAAALWQRIGERRAILPLFGAALAAAVSCHYLAVVAVSNFVVAEIVWSALHRRPRWGVWGALCLATFPFLLGLPFALNFRAVYGDHYWSRADITTVRSTYEHYLGGEFNLALLLSLAVVVSACYAVPGMMRRHRQNQLESGFPLSETALICAFALYPAWLVLLTMVMGSGYVPRYGLPVMIGLAAGLAYLLRAVWPRAEAVVLPGALLIFVLLRAGFEVNWVVRPAASGTGAYWAKLVEIGRADPALPIVIAPSKLYLEAAQYAPVELRSRLVNVVDPDAALRWTGTDSIDRSNEILARVAPLRVVRREPFQAANSKFILFVGSTEFEWLLPYLTRSGYPLKLLSKSGSVSIYLAGR